MYTPLPVAEATVGEVVSRAGAGDGTGTDSEPIDSGGALETNRERAAGGDQAAELDEVRPSALNPKVPNGPKP